MTVELEQKFHKLQQILREKQRVAIAFSGGVDSSFLLWTAHQTLGENACAITILGDMVSEEEAAEAREFTAAYGISHQILPVDICALESFANNPSDRCYHCKKYLFAKLLEQAEQQGMVVAEGSNLDDLGDYRPGRKALSELSILSPMLEAGLTKEEIRALSHFFGLPTWNKPSCACLASRVPYETRITPEILQKVSAAERVLHPFGISGVRVRYHEEIARIECGVQDFEMIFAHREEIDRAIKACGFRYVTVDLEPYRTGRLNDFLPDAKKEKSVDKPFLFRYNRRR